MSGAEDSNSSVSSASDAMAGDPVHEDEGAIGIGESLDADFYRDVLERLDDVNISTNIFIPEDEDDSKDEDTFETESFGAESSASDSSKDTKHPGLTETDRREISPVEPEVPRKNSSTPSKKPLKDKKVKDTSGSVFSKLRRLTKSDKKSRQKSTESSLSEIKIEKLPQIFIAKYLGAKPTKGLFGLHHVRKPVDRMIGALKKDLGETDRVELPLVYVVISSKGIEIREHASTKVKDVGNLGLVPIDFVSYGVQDMNYWKVFTFIVVKELSSRTKTTECHAVLCDSNITARKMALSLAAAFRVYKKTLNKEGKSNNFSVELRTPGELVEAYTEECDA